jgi:hypothetical protein
MATTSRIGHVSIRSRLSHDWPGERGRLERMWRDLSARALGRALEEAGLPADEIICVRRLDLQMRLWLGQTDEAMVAEWAAGVARAVRQELDAARVDSVITFRSTLAAVVDAVRGLVRGSTTRAWAWRQVELPVDGPVRDAVVRVLVHEPRQTLPALTVLAGDEPFTAWASRIPDEAWDAVAGTALRVSGRPLLDPAPVTREEIEEAAAAASRILSRSPLRRIAVRAAAGRGAAGREALAVLSVLASEPACLDRPGTAAMAIVLAVARALEEDAFDAPAPPRQAIDGASPNVAGREALSPHRDEGRRDVHDASGAAANRRAGESPNADVSQAADSARQAPAAAAQTARGHADGASPSERDSSAGDASNTSAPDAPPTLEQPDDFERGPIDIRRRGRTQWGGLLFLLHVVDETGVPARATGAGPLAAHSLVWVLHRIALLIVPCAPDDPAALAFAGLAPDAPVPDEGDASADVQAALLELADAIHTAAAGRLAMDPEAEDLFTLCARTAEVVADPGWVDVHFPLDSVSLQVRRAGLDVDPGFLPWLGVVVRFTYV